MEAAAAAVAAATTAAIAGVVVPVLACVALPVELVALSFVLLLGTAAWVSIDTVHF